ncbi:putative krueppel c2h2-type zinc finger protein [Golovinomyces cichoracearum]|uniref:Putative krueppel c2h2-type zinc finger protein n=1 Tax=Golovinomyces cichoracearum TaxID=62708 RepID=A0A420I0W2_9PEZI|nr:putative krueppel c2h2-type zinc finger protein [Golovinomyces cichoracearum]
MHNLRCKSYSSGKESTLIGTLTFRVSPIGFMYLLCSAESSSSCNQPLPFKLNGPSRSCRKCGERLAQTSQLQICNRSRHINPSSPPILLHASSPGLAVHRAVKLSHQPIYLSRHLSIFQSQPMMTLTTASSSPACGPAASSPKCDSIVKKRFTCNFSGCGKCFSRSEHLHRHALNHKDGNNTCLRCMAHFRRRDLLDRHMARHKEKDDEAGGEGLGVLATRKRLWRDAEGNIVNARRPSYTQDGTKRRQSRRQEKKKKNPIIILDEGKSKPLNNPSILESCVQALLEKNKADELSPNPWLEIAALPSPPTSDIDPEAARPNSRVSFSENLDTLYEDPWPSVFHDFSGGFNNPQVMDRQPEYHTSPTWATQEIHTFMGAIEESQPDDIFKLNASLYGWQAMNNQLVTSRCREERVDKYEEKKRLWPTNSAHDEILRRGFGLSTCQS